MEKMKIGIVTVATLALVAVAVSVLVINSGIVLATGPSVTEHINAVVKIEKNGNDVDVEVKAQGLATNVVFTVRAYNALSCTAPPLATTTGNTIGSDSDRNGNIAISGTVTGKDVTDVNSVSIRSPAGPGPIVVCFQNTTP